MAIPIYLGSARNTINRGTWSYLKPYDRHHLKFITESWAKANFWSHLGYAYSAPELVYLKRSRFSTGLTEAYMVVVRKLTTIYDAPIEVDDRYYDEVALWGNASGINTVGDLRKLDTSRFTWLQPALTYIRNTFTADTPLGDDFDKTNAMWDKENDEIVPHDMFNLDWMEENGKILDAVKKNSRRKSW